MLLNYRNSVHSTTNVIPAQLLFNRELKTFLPSINKKLISNLDQEIRTRQDQKYKKSKNILIKDESQYTLSSGKVIKYKC